MNSDQQIQQGMQFLSAGEISEADAVFCKILEQDPDFADALYGRACVCLLASKPDLAIGFAGMALQNKNRSDYYTVLGMALYEKKHYPEARSALRSAVILNPSDARAFNMLAKVLTVLHDYRQAETAFREAVQLQQDEFFYWNDLIDFYWDRKAFETALAIAQESVRANPGEVSFLYKLGLVLKILDLLPEAESVFRKLIRLCPYDVTAYANLGAVLLSSNKVGEAQKWLEKAVAAQPGNIQTQVNFALVQMARGYLLEAGRLLWEAYQQKPEDRRIGIDLGIVLYELGQIDQARDLYEQLLEKAPGYMETERDRYRIFYNLSTVLLAKGEFKAGFAYMECRHVLLDSWTGYEFIPVWDGKSQEGCLLLRTEQGLGDSLQFMRYLPYPCQKIPVVLEVQKTLFRLVQEMVGQFGLQKQCKVMMKGDMVPKNVTCQLMLMSLPHVLEMEYVPGLMPFTLIPVRFSETEMESGKHHVGICWAGSADYRFDRLRSLSVDQFAPVFSIKNIEFHALQMDCPKTILKKYGMHPLPEGDMLQTAFVIQKLDLVITVDTVIAHLAGILGKKVWLLNRYGGDWRWQEGNMDQEGNNIWYPTVRIFRQDQIPGQENKQEAWRSVIARIRLALLSWKEK